eukprot:TRINITY_DN493_c1_g1_i1.p1 TRINITY_DN493_c1_g1~~TRINITY_DN493_c1_g1_i1.p1  ORF type:complete len:487 (+),score=106.95 TRINITY_DN493_c1_g1_i1:91-1461(+)
MAKKKGKPKEAVTSAVAAEDDGVADKLATKKKKSLKKTKVAASPSEPAVIEDVAALADVPKTASKKKKKKKQASAGENVASMGSTTEKVTSKKRSHSETAALVDEDVQKTKKKKRKPAAVEKSEETASAPAKAEAPEADEESEDSFFAEADESGKPQQRPVASDDRKVWVGDMPWNVSESTVRKDFSECGEIERFDMPKNKKGLPDGIAFIYYATDEGVEKALEYDGTEYHGRTIRVKRAKKQDKENRTTKTRTDDDLTVCIAGLSYDTKEDQLTKDFGECGSIDAVRMLRTPDGKFKGIAFVAYKAKDAVSKALEWNGEYYFGRTLKVSKPQTSGKEKEGGDGKGKGKGKGKSNAEKTDRTVFVGSLALDSVLETLKSDFAEAGEIEEIRMVKSSDGEFKGAAFVEFKTADGAQKLLEWDGGMYGGNTIKVAMARMGNGGKGKQKDSKGKGKGKK